MIDTQKPWSHKARMCMIGEDVYDKTLQAMVCQDATLARCELACHCV